MSFDNNTIPIRVTNSCPDTLWPGIGTQHGVGPGVGGFVLEAGKSHEFSVSWDWQGRVWGRTNCSFNEDGSGPLNKTHGVDGSGAACTTGDCGGKVNCTLTGATPSTLAEFNLFGGVSGRQTFYDISLVDGYNLPMGIVYIPADNTTFIPPNLVNPSCIATAGYLDPVARSGTTYTNATYPMPYESTQDNDDARTWCPWELQKYEPELSRNGLFQNPDDHAERPIFNPCLSACAATGSKQDCCTGDHNTPAVCKASSYSRAAKRVCPDAYSFAFDDQTSTFIMPSGGGWEVVFCPRGRSTNILETFGDQLRALASSGNVTRRILDDVTSIEYINTHPSSATRAATSGDVAHSLRSLVIAWVLGAGLLFLAW